MFFHALFYRCNNILYVSVMPLNGVQQGPYSSRFENDEQMRQLEKEDDSKMDQGE